MISPFFAWHVGQFFFGIFLLLFFYYFDLDDSDCFSCCVFMFVLHFVFSLSVFSHVRRRQRSTFVENPFATWPAQSRSVSQSRTS